MATKAHIGAYGAPISKRVGSALPLSREQLLRAGAIILEEIKREIKIDAVKAGNRAPGQPVPIPLSPAFADSFTVRVRGNSTIEIESTWPTAGAHTSPKSSINLDRTTVKQTGPMEMKWLTRDKVPYVQITQSSGAVVVRSTPDPRQGQKHWIHPGFRRYSFLERGLKKGRERVVREFAAELLQELAKSTNIFE